MKVFKNMCILIIFLCVHETNKETDKSKAELDDTQWERIKNQYVPQRITQNILAEKQKKECCLL